MLLPAIRHVSLNIPSITDNYLHSMLAQQPVGPRLSSLTLAFTHLNEHGLYRLLLFCPGLQILKYDYWTRSPEEDWDDPMPEFDHEGSDGTQWTGLGQASVQVQLDYPSVQVHLSKSN
jgi:hypothetical protein